MERAGSPGRTSRARITRSGCHGAGRLPGRPTSVPGAPRPARFVWRVTACSSPRRAVGRLGGHSLKEDPQGWVLGVSFYPRTGVPLSEGVSLSKEPNFSINLGLETGQAADTAAAGVSRRAAVPFAGRKREEAAGGGSSPRRCPGEPRPAAQPWSGVPGGSGPGRAVPAVGAGGVRTRPVHARVA